MPDHGMDLSMDLGESLQYYLTTCITKVLRFPRARCTIFFLFVNFLFWETFQMVKSTTILVQLTFYLEFET